PSARDSDHQRALGNWDRRESHYDLDQWIGSANSKIGRSIAANSAGGLITWRQRRCAEPDHASKSQVQSERAPRCLPLFHRAKETKDHLRIYFNRSSKRFGRTSASVGKTRARPGGKS